MTYVPLQKLGISATNTNFSFSCTFILENTSTIKETILECTALYNNIYITNIFTGNIITFNGNVPLEVFDQYQMQYVDKGKSDKNQTPVISTIQNMPDHKELYKITPDSRASIEIPIELQVKVQKKIITESSSSSSDSSSTGSTSEVIEIIEEVINLKIEILNDLNYISNWTKDYFNNRY